MDIHQIAVPIPASVSIKDTENAETSTYVPDLSIEAIKPTYIGVQTNRPSSPFHSLLDAAKQNHPLLL